MERAQRSVLDKTVAAVEMSDLDVTATEEIGDPASALSDYCEQVGAGLLIVGRRGAGMVERLVLGSVADRLAHHAPCALMIVP
jgi:nucleotide-binding universal stress UspA family protein